MRDFSAVDFQISIIRPVFKEKLWPCSPVDMMLPFIVRGRRLCLKLTTEASGPVRLCMDLSWPACRFLLACLPVIVIV